MTDKTEYMLTKPELYTDNLSDRLAMNQMHSQLDFEAWIFSNCTIGLNSNLLDIACGTGHVISKLLDTYPELRIVGIDISEKAIANLKVGIDAKKLDNVQALVEDMETFPSKFPDRRFDQIISVYGIHYSLRMVDLLAEYGKLLNPEGKIFFCGPDSFSNTNLMKLLNSSKKMEENPIPTRLFSPCVQEEDLEQLRRTFKSVTLVQWENRIKFPDKDSFMTWWRNHDLYRPSLETYVLGRVREIIDREGGFELNKRVIGVGLEKLIR